MSALGCDELREVAADLDVGAALGRRHDLVRRCGLDNDSQRCGDEQDEKARYAEQGRSQHRRHSVIGLACTGRARRLQACRDWPGAAQERCCVPALLSSARPTSPLALATFAPHAQSLAPGRPPWTAQPLPSCCLAPAIARRRSSPRRASCHPPAARPNCRGWRRCQPADGSTERALRRRLRPDCSVAGGKVVDTGVRFHRRLRCAGTPGKVAPGSTDGSVATKNRPISTMPSNMSAPETADSATAKQRALAAPPSTSAAVRPRALRICHRDAR